MIDIGYQDGARIGYSAQVRIEHEYIINDPIFRYEQLFYRGEITLEEYLKHIKLPYKIAILTREYKIPIKSKLSFDDLLSTATEDGCEYYMLVPNGSHIIILAHNSADLNID